MADDDAVGPRWLVGRARNLLLRPRREWAVIDREPVKFRRLFLGYAAPLALVPILAPGVGLLLFDAGWIGEMFEPWSMAEVVLIGYLMSLGFVVLLALSVQLLAPVFGGRSSWAQAFKVAVYAQTATWAAGAFNILPALSGLSFVLGLYSLYLLYTGMPVLMKTLHGRALPYAAVVVLVTWLLASAVVGLLFQLSIAAGGPDGLAGRRLGG